MTRTTTPDWRAQEPSVDRLRAEFVSQSFGGVQVLDEVSLDVEPGEFLTLLGPSGCGKTSLLRIMCGFARPRSGRILLGDRDVTRMPAHRRPMNMVFQRATLFPHLDVFENVAFGLRVASVPTAEVRRRVAEALALVRLSGYEHRRSHQLSGGQTQRVALARALVNRPRVLLLDEPLSALDQRIKLDMESELRRVHRETRATFVYVTHDQREALALSDRIAVLDHGRIEQLGTPQEIYRTPATPFAARFVGDANVVPVRVSRGPRGLMVDVFGARIPTSVSVLDGDSVSSGPAWLVVRPEASTLGSTGDGFPWGRIADVAFRGSGHAYKVAIDGADAIIKVELQGPADPPLPLGAPVSWRWEPAAARLLAREGSS